MRTRRHLNNVAENKKWLEYAQNASNLFQLRARIRFGARHAILAFQTTCTAFLVWQC